VILRGFFAALLVAGAEAGVVQWTSYSVPPLVLLIDFVTTAAVLSAVVVPVTAVLAATRYRSAAGAAATVVAVAVYDLSRIRTEKLALGDAATIAVGAVLLVGVARVALRAVRADASERSAVVESIGLIAATAAALILCRLGGKFVPTATALALLAITTAVQLAVAVRLGPLAARLAAVAVVIAAAAASYPFVPGFLEPAAAAPRPAESAPKTPSVVVIVMDTVRADHLSLYGYEHPTSPELEKLAARAHVFRRAIANSNWSLPSHATLLTGLLPHQHGAHTVVSPAAADPSSPRLVDITQQPLAEANETIVETLRGRGYATGAVTANYAWVTKESGLLQGFDYVDDRSGMLVAWEPFCGAYLRHLPVASLRDLYARKTSSKLGADDIVDHSLAFVDAVGRGPFFLLVNFMDGHAPYGSALRAELVPEIRERFRKSRWRAANLEPYDRSIAFLDHEVGRFFRELEARRIFDDALVVVTSDHGERFGEGNRGWHGADLSQESVRVPLLIKLPGESSPQTIDRRAQLADVVPTILDAVGLPASKSFFGSPLALASRAVIAENYLASGGRGTAPRSISLDELDERLPTEWAIFDGDWKLVREAGGRNRLYDVARDPAEAEDRAASEPEVTRRLAEELAALLPREAFTGYRTPVVQAKASNVTIEKLRSLGYAQ